MGYVIAKDYSYVLNILASIDKMAKDAGDLADDGTYATLIPLKGVDINGVPHEEHHTDRWWFPAPPDKYKDFLPWEVTDTLPENTLQRYYRIYSMLTSPEKEKFKDWTVPPFSVDYKVDLLQRLYPQRKFTGGYLTEVIYYAAYDRATKVYSDPVVKVKATYYSKDDAQYSASKTTEYREVERTWYFEDGEEDTVNKKLTDKEYPTVIEYRAEGTRRRQNLFNLTSQDLVILLMVTQTTWDQELAEDLAFAFMDKHEKEIDLWKTVGKDLMVDTIENETDFSWLENVIPATTFYPVVGAEVPIQALAPDATPGDTLRQHFSKRFKGDI